MSYTPPDAGCLAKMPAPGHRKLGYRPINAINLFLERREAEAEVAPNTVRHDA